MSATHPLHLSKLGLPKKFIYLSITRPQSLCAWKRLNYYPNETCDWTPLKSTPRNMYICTHYTISYSWKITMFNIETNTCSRYNMVFNIIDIVFMFIEYMIILCRIEWNNNVIKCERINSRTRWCTPGHGFVFVNFTPAWLNKQSCAKYTSAILRKIKWDVTNFKQNNTSVIQIEFFL